MPSVGPRRTKSIDCKKRNDVNSLRMSAGTFNLI